MVVLISALSCTNADGANVPISVYGLECLISSRYVYWLWFLVGLEGPMKVRRRISTKARVGFLSRAWISCSQLAWDQHVQTGL